MNSRTRHSNSVSFFVMLALFLGLFMGIPASCTAQQTTLTRPLTPTQLRTLAESGDAVAQHRLARFMLRHNPSSEDVQTGLKWLRASVAQNNPDAEFYLGYLYEHGQFVPRDYGLAMQNYQAAAKQQYAPAENNIASLYQHGQGVKKNPGKASEWYLAAAQHGNAVGQINLANMYYGGEGVARDYGQTIYWLRKSAETGFPDAENNLAYFYFTGIGIQQDYTEAARLIRLAAEQNLAAAETSLGYLYELGKGVPLDYVAAYSWYSRGAAGGDHIGEVHRKQLARIMTKKQVDEANTLTAVATTESPIPITLPVGNTSFSLLNH